jgi:iron complex outermembrane receptor protein
VERDYLYQITNLSGTARNAGLELLSTIRKGPFSATASYVYVNSTQPEPGQRVDTPLTPRQSFGLTGMWEKSDIWRIGAECYYTGRQRLEENPYRSESEPYVLVGFLAERRFGPFRLFLNAENLGDVRQTNWNPLLRPDRGVDGRWTVDAWAPLDGRVFNGGVRIRF